MIQGYTLATFPKVAQYIFMHNPRRNRQENLAAVPGKASATSDPSVFSIGQHMQNNVVSPTTADVSKFVKT